MCREGWGLAAENRGVFLGKGRNRGGHTKKKEESNKGKLKKVKTEIQRWSDIRAPSTVDNNRGLLQLKRQK